MNILNKHKTKITGMLLVLVGSLQASSTSVQALLSPRQYALFTILIGLVVALLGFLNNPSNEEKAQ